MSQFHYELSAQYRQQLSSKLVMGILGSVKKWFVESICCINLRVQNSHFKRDRHLIFVASHVPARFSYLF